MMMNIIFVNRFVCSNGVGHAAISLFEDLEDLGFEVQVWCMRKDKKYQIDNRVKSFPLKLPYSFEVFVLTLITFVVSFFSGEKNILHGFETFSPKLDFYHLHYDYSLSKNIDNSWRVRRVARTLAQKLNLWGFHKHVSSGKYVFVPSNLLKKRIIENENYDDDFVIVLPNKLSKLDFQTIALFAKARMDFSTKSSNVQFFKIALVAHGDLEFKGIGSFVKNFLFFDVPCQLFLVGSTVKFSKNIAQEKSIENVGFLNRTELFEFYSDISAVYISSRFESFSMVALEAIILGVPIIYTGEMGITDDYEEFLREFQCENLLFKYKDLNLSIDKLGFRHNPQLNFNEFLSTKRIGVLKVFLKDYFI